MMSLCGDLAELNLAAEPLTARDFTIQRWTADKGLPQNRISALAQTTDGYLWLGTWFGVARFDGLRFTIFNRYNTPALASDEINALAATPDGTLWIGTRDGLVRFREGAWKRFTEDNGLPTKGVWELAVDSAGGLWMAGDRHKIGRFPDGPFTEVIWPIEVTGFRVPEHKFLVLPDGQVAVVTPKGPAFLPAATNLVYLPLGIGTRPTIHALVGDADGQIWFGSRDRFWNGSVDLFPTVAPHHGASKGTDLPADLEMLFRQRNGTIWMTLHNAGLHHVDGFNFEPMELIQGERQPNVTAFLEDLEGSLWIATDAGLFQMRRRAIKVITKADGLPSDEIWSVSEGPNKTIWTATKHGPSCLGRWRVAPESTSKQVAGIRCVVAHPDGTLWMDYWDRQKNGLLERKPNGSESVLFEGESVQALYLDRMDRLWVGTDRRVRCFQKGLELQLPGLPAVEIRFSLQARDGAMWFGSRRSGLYRRQHGELRQFTMEDGLADDFVIALHEDSEGILWIATHHGLNRLVLSENQPRFVTFTTRHGLLDNLINHILEDDKGYLWFSSNRGIFRMARAELNAIAAGQKPEAACAVFGTADGMVSSETNGEHQPAGCKADDGRLWFPTMMGVVVIDPERISTSEAPPGVVLEQVKVDGEAIYGDGAGNAIPESSRVDNLRAVERTSTVRLKPGRARVVEIRYTANTFVAPERLRFKYKLEGYDSDWRNAAPSERLAYYTNLRPGNYLFRVKACNNHGVWNETRAPFAFSLAPTFTQTIWFPILSALGILGVTGGLTGWRLKWQRRVLTAEQNARLERERTRIARDLHDDLGTALTGLALELDVIGRDAQKMPACSNRLNETAQHTRTLAERMREVVWAINPRCDTVPSLASFLEQQTAQFLQSDQIRGRLEFPDEIPNLHVDSESRHQLTLAMREALTNVVRHSSATEVVVRMMFEERALVLEIIDNGKGFTDIPQIGHGLHNIRDRLERIQGRFAYASAHGKGTTLTFRIPIGTQSEAKERVQA